MKPPPDKDLRHNAKGLREPLPSVAFLSHTAADYEFINTHVIPQQCGYRHNFVLFNYRVPGGVVSDAYRKEILTLMGDAAWFVVAVSTRAVESKWVNFEASWAVEHRSADRIVVLIIEGCDLNELSPKLLRCRYVDFREDPSKARRCLELTMPEVCSA